MTQQTRSQNAFRVAELAQNTPTQFALRPENTALKAIAAELGLSGLRKLSFTGHIEGAGASDWRLVGQLGVTVVQPCVITLQPVTTRIDVPVERLYQQDYVDIDAPEVEMPEDDTIERLGAWIDPETVMLEALALNLPLYPRAEDATFGKVAVTEPGSTPMTDEDAKPFAGLAALKAQLRDEEDPD